MLIWFCSCLSAYLQPEDELVLQQVQKCKVPVILVINKIDQIQDKDRLLPHIQELVNKHVFSDIIPVSALGGHNLERLEMLVKRGLPEGPFLFPEDQVTDRSSRFIAAEMIREKVTRQLGDELPYEVTVEIERFKLEGTVTHVHGLILVDKPGQKKIIIGNDGSRLKQIGSAARADMDGVRRQSHAESVGQGERGGLMMIVPSESRVSGLTAVRDEFQDHAAAGLCPPSKALSEYQFAG